MYNFTVFGWVFVINKKPWETTMVAIAFDTLNANRLKSVGVPDKQAEAMAEMQAEVFDRNLEGLAIKQDIDTKLERELAPIRTELAVIKWMLGIQMAGIMTIILQSFFLH